MTRPPDDPARHDDDAVRGASRDLNLPPLPAVAQKLLSCLQSGSATAQEVADLLSPDVGLVSQIMKIVNSAYYGLPSPIKNVTHAVAYLGLNEVRRVVLTAAAMEHLKPRSQADFDRFWYHSFHTALSAKLIARNHRPGPDTEELHVAALLHDIGKLVHLKLSPERYAAIVALASERKVPFLEAERQLGLVPHTELGAALCEHWMLPDSVRRACRHHELDALRAHNRDPLAEWDDTTTVCVANLLSGLALFDLERPAKDAIREAVATALAFDDREFLLLMGELYALKTEVEAFLGQL